MTDVTGRTIAQNTGLVMGVAVFAATLLTAPPADLAPAAWHVADAMLLMAIWWATEALPFAARALVPLAVLPPLGAASASDLAQGYGNTTLFLILGGFLLALAMERCNLHRRIAYTIVSWAGGHPQGLVLGMMCATGFVSMWAQNTSTTVMMLPVAMSVAVIVAPDSGSGDRGAKNFARAIILCVAYAATIGGLGTLVGTATNALVVGFMLQNYGETISFAQWLVFGIPTVLLLMPAQLEAAFLARLMSRLGVSEEAAATAVASAPVPPARARIVPNQPGATLQVDDNFDRAWRRVGLALDRGGFTVEDRDRTQGLYFVRYIDPKDVGKAEPGFFVKLFGKDADTGGLSRYRILVKSDGERSNVLVQNAQGAPEAGATGQRIVSLLLDELK